MALIQCAAESGTASFPIILHPVLHPNSTERCTARAPSEGAHRLPERASLRCSPLFFSSRSLSAEDLIIHSGTDTEQTTVTHRLSCQMAQHRARSIHTRANSLLVVELRGDCGWTAWSAHRQDEEPCTLLRRLARCTRWRRMRLTRLLCRLRASCAAAVTRIGENQR